MIDVSVVILSWNDLPYLTKCLDSIKAAAGGCSCETIVVDNASTDGTPDEATAKYPWARFVRNQTNLGFSGGNNVGVKASTGRYVCLLNSDVELLGNCLEKLVRYMDSQCDIGMIGPRILNGDGTHQSSCRVFPSVWNNICSATGLAKAFQTSRFFSGEHMFYFKGDRLIDVDVLVGCFWMVRRAALDRFGLLDDGFFMYAEDVDWCKRCWNAGWRVTFYPDAQAIHYRGGSSTKKDPVWIAVTQQQSILRYWKKHHGFLGTLAMRLVMIFHKAFRWFLFFFRSITAPASKGSAREQMRVSFACLLDLLCGKPSVSG